MDAADPRERVRPRDRTYTHPWAATEEDPLGFGWEFVKDIVRVTAKRRVLKIT